MPQDAFTLRHLCVELNNLFAGGKVNRIIQPSPDELVLTLYTGKRTEKLLINVNPSSPRIGVEKGEKESPLTAPNFCMLMRKHLLNATLLSVKLLGFDRIVEIEFLSYGEFFDSVKKVMYVELMGRYSNIILTENSKILGGNRGINMFDNGVRPLIVGQKYVLPPVGEKKLPKDETLIEVFDKAQKNSLNKLICDNVQGIAISTANEVIAEYFKDRQNDLIIENGNDFFVHLNEFLYRDYSRPCVVKKAGEITDVCVYPYAFNDVEFEYFDSLIDAEDYYFRERDRQKLFKNRKERLGSLTNTAIKKVKKKLTAIKAKEKDALQAEENRIKGELLFANIYKIKNGEDKVVLENYYDGTEIVIALDQRLSVSKNAENYYKKYNKQKRTLTALAPQKTQAQSELNYFESLLDEITLCENLEELNLVKTELESVGLIVEKQQVRKKKEQESLFRVYNVYGFTVKVGRNNIENDKLTFTARAEDIWLHAKDYHSSHLIIESNGKSVPENVIITSAQICAYYSKGREGGKTEIVYTEKKNVKKPSKSKLGFVTYENFKSVVVVPEKHAEFLK